MMKVFILSVFTLFVFKAADAQAPVSGGKAISLGFELGIPNRNAYSIGLGASVKGELPVVSALSVSLTGGYSVFFHKNSIFTAADTQGPSLFFPLKGGFRYFLGESFYAEAEAGAAIETNYEQSHLFIFSIGPGFIIPVSEHRNVDLGFRYESWSQHTLQQTAVRVAYRFK